jgi:nitrate/nitrite-specific signal transduction histidine kinase
MYCENSILSTGKLSLPHSLFRRVFLKACSFLESFRSLHNRLNIIFLTFLVCVGASVTATFLAIRVQSHDAALINLAGRQRMLSQQMTWRVLADPDSPDLPLIIQRFHQTLDALRNGGQTVDAAGESVTLPGAPDSTLRARLDDAAALWAIFNSHIEALRSLSLDDPTRGQREQALQSASLQLLARLDEVVAGFEARAKAKVRRLQTIQAIFFSFRLDLAGLELSSRAQSD